MSQDKRANRIFSQEEKRKLRPELVIAILSLIITTFVALYLNKRNQEFQQQLLRLQGESALANMTLTYENGSINVGNLGPAIAQDLRIVVCILSIDPKWFISINSISDFEISIDNPALDSNTKKTYCKSQLSSLNAVQISIKSLPPKQTIEINIRPSLDVSLKDMETELNIYIQQALESSFVNFEENATYTVTETNLTSSPIPVFSPYPHDLVITQSSFLSSPLNTALDNYLSRNLFKIADIETSMACTNCNIDMKKFVLSSFIDKRIDQLESVSSFNDLKIHVNVLSHFFLPEIAKPDTEQSLYLAAKTNVNNEVEMVESSMFEFATPTPTLTNETPSMGMQVHVYADKNIGTAPLKVTFDARNSFLRAFNDKIYECRNGGCKYTWGVYINRKKLKS